jgi:hypothetical protein
MLSDQQADRIIREQNQKKADPKKPEVGPFPKPRPNTAADSMVRQAMGVGAFAAKFGEALARPRK